MKIREINRDNIGDFHSLIPPDVEENIGRLWFRGYAVDDGEGENVRAGFVWEYKNADEDELDTTVEIVWVKVDDKEALDALFKTYQEQLVLESAVLSEVELPMKFHGTMTEDAFFENGFTMNNGESCDLIVTLKDIADLKLGKKKSPFYIKPLKDLDYRQFRNGVIECLFHGRKGLLQDFAWLSLDWFESDVSSSVVMDDKVEGYFLVHKMQSGMLAVVFMFSSGIDARRNVLEMVRFSIREAVKKYPLETKVIIRRHNKATHALTDKLFPGKKGEEVIVGSREEQKGGMAG